MGLRESIYIQVPVKGVNWYWVQYFEHHKYNWFFIFQSDKNRLEIVW